MPGGTPAPPDGGTSTSLENSMNQAGGGLPTQQQQAPALSAASHKGYPAWAPPLALSAIGQQGWSVLQPDWPLPSAVIRQTALQHNLGWMQKLVTQAGAELAPHGKTTLSPELFRAQLAAGAWGITLANVAQLAMGVAHGLRRALIANQVLLPHDLQWLAKLLSTHPTLQAPFWLDSPEQLQAIEQAAVGLRLDVLIELGLPNGRTGCRQDGQALALARAAHRSPAVRLVGLACYEGLWAQADSEADTAMVHALLQRVHQLAETCEAEGLFDNSPEVIITSGGSAVFDLVAPQLRPRLHRPVRALLRSGCYLTHDHGTYRRFATPLQHRLASQGLGGQAWDCRTGLQAALEVWAAVVSCPEPGLVILNAGKRDLSHDAGLPTPVHWCPTGQRQTQACPAQWTVTALNDQHAYLQLGPGPGPLPRVGDRVALGISHPCTTFDRWRWMPLINDHGDVVDAISTHFG